MKATNETIEYRGFNITVHGHNSRFGILWATENDYGEPYTDDQLYYQDKNEAIDIEKTNLDACIDQ